MYSEPNDPHWRDYENKIYKDKKGFWVRLESCSVNKYFRVATNGEETSEKIRDLDYWTILDTARDNLELAAKKCGLVLIHSR